MSTGGIALLLASTPHRFPGLTTIGKVVYIFDLVIFVAIVAAITARFTITPASFSKAISHPTEMLFIPTSFLSLVSIFSGAQIYGVPSTGPWLPVALRVLFWIYVGATFLLCVGLMWFLIHSPATRLTLSSMTPAWNLPAFPIMLSGTLAATIAPNQPLNHRLSITIAGITFQGLGWMVSFVMDAMYMHRLIQYGLPAPNLRPGQFILVGPPSFTSLALIGLAEALPPDFDYFALHPLALDVLKTLALFVAVFLWALAFFFFCLSLISVLHGIKKMSFHLVWWALIFPNTGFAIATIDIGERFGSQGILWIGSVMTILLVAMWLFVLAFNVKAVITKQIVMPGMDEDKDQYAEEVLADKNK